MPASLSAHPGYRRVFHPRRMTLGLVVPIESYPDGPVPQMHRHLERVALAEELGFAAVWLRDVPFQVPSFGDAGQLYDPFVYLGMLAGRTTDIALGVASIILPLRHPAHVAKAAASADGLSGGRLLLGVASGDRPDEYPAMGVSYTERGARFRESFAYIERMAESFPSFESPRGRLHGIDLVPKPVAGRLPMLITGSCQQSPDWVAAHGCGWMTYPRPVPQQAWIVDEYRRRVAAQGAGFKPVMQPLYLDLVDDDRPARPLHLGVRVGVHGLRQHLRALEEVGVNHVALNLRFQRGDVESVLRTLAAEILPAFGVPRENNP